MGTSRTEWRSGCTWQWAYGGTMCLAIALLLWGVAPLVVHWSLSGVPPTRVQTVVSALTLLAGAAYLSLSILIRRRAAWATVTTFLLSIAILFVTLSSMLSIGTTTIASFVVVMTAIVCVATWLAIADLKEQIVRNLDLSALATDES